MSYDIQLDPVTHDLAFGSLLAPAEMRVSAIPVPGRYPYPASSLSGFKRASTATYFDSDTNTIKTAGVDEPRYEGGLLVMEQQRTNRMLWNRDFAQAAWTKAGGGVGSAPIITPNFALGPDGLMTADRVQLAMNGGTSGADFSLIQQQLTAVIGNPIAISRYIKATGPADIGKIVAMRGADSVTYTPVTLTGQWQRVTHVSNASVASPFFQAAVLRGGIGTSDSADFLLWGAQAENGAYPTSVILTDGAALTRAADSGNVIEMLPEREVSDLLLVDGAQRVAQQIKVTLLAFLGEWFLDTSFGVPYLEEILVKNPRPAVINAILRARILDVPQVSRIASLRLDFDRQRRSLLVTFEADTPEGLTGPHNVALSLQAA